MPQGPDWDGDAGSWTERECISSSEQFEHNVESLALNAMGKTNQVKRFLSSWRIGGLRGWL